MKIALTAKRFGAEYRASNGPGSNRNLGYNIIMNGTETQGVPPTQGKDWLVALLLSIFLGSLGVDRFYMGSIGLGICKLLTCGGVGIWYIIDIILIATNKAKDGNGNPLVKK